MPFWQASVSESPIATCVRPAGRGKVEDVINNVADGEEDADDEEEEMR